MDCQIHVPMSGRDVPTDARTQVIQSVVSYLTDRASPALPLSSEIGQEARAAVYRVLCSKIPHLCGTRIPSDIWRKFCL
jgi:hypothetical protein